MAPAKRKRAAAAAAAAAAAKWKVGDLVLAKMKGFPAWPAMISEPEQWKMPSTKKKPLVYFYGTKQIAFCNYADLEAFTEEKKRSLLAKRHGKGADFLRAVDEIIEVYDSLKDIGSNKVDLPAEEVKPGVEKFAENNSRMDTEDLVSSSYMHNDRKIEDHYVTTRSHDMVNSDRPSVDERCVVNSAPDEPIENVSILDEMRDISLRTNSFSNKQRDAQPQNCYTRTRVPSLRKSRSSLSLESRKAQDNVWLHSGEGTSNQPVTLGASNGNRMLNTPAEVDSTSNREASENGTTETELKSNGTSDLPMNTAVNFKRKRKSDRKPGPHYRDCTTPNKDDQLCAEYSEILPDSPNSKNEVSKSDGDEHLPLVKRARVRMGRSQLEDSPVDEIDVSNKKPELATALDQCDRNGKPASPANDYSADQVSAVVSSAPNLSCKLDTTILSKEGHLPWKNKEYHPKILALDVEAALPPSKRLHRALEAMSANVAENTKNIPEVTGPNEMTLNGSLLTASSLSNKSADAVVTVSNRPVIVQSPEPSLDTQFVHNPSGKCTSESILQNNSIPDSASVPSKENDHIVLKGDICEETLMDTKTANGSWDCSELNNDSCGKTSALCMKLNRPALNVTQATSVPDRLSSSLEKASENVAASGVKETKTFGSAVCDVDRSAEPIDRSNNNVTSNTMRHSETIVADSVNNVGDTASNSSLATKSSSIQSDADTRTSELHTFSSLALKELNHRKIKDRSTSPDSMPMKELIAVAQARRFSRSTSFPDNFLNAKYIPETSINIPSKEGPHRQLSPSNRIIRSTSGNDNVNSRSPFDNIQQKKLAAHGANAARRSFKDFLSTLTRTKESISRATRLAMECAKFGIAGEAIDIIVEHLEKESNLYKRVDLFFLVDSITQCSRNQKGGAGDVYPSLIQAVLPRILYAAAPPGNSAWENRKQCLKVLKLWLERKTLSEYIIRHHIREIETINEASFGSSRRPSRTERALNDPLRDNEGMLVDEYGSNAGFQLPNLICTKVLEEEEENSSEGRSLSFEAVTPEQDAPYNDDNEESQMPVEKHHHILEEVDGELEMEDVAPPSDIGATTKCQPEQSDTNRAPSDQRPSDAGPPLPVDRPPSPPPLPSSPPPVPVPQSAQMQPKLQMASDPMAPHPQRATYSVQSQQQHSIAEHPGNMNSSVAPLPPPPFNSSGYGGQQNQIPPPPPMAPLNPPGPHGSFPAPPAPYHGNNYHRPPTTSMPNEGYHQQPPPPPPPPNQFPSVPPEHQHRPHHWGNNCPPYPERYRYNGHDRGNHRHDRRHHGHDRQHHYDDRGYHYDDRGYHYDDRGHYFDDRRHHFDDRGHHFDERAIRGPMHNDAADQGRYSFPPGPPRIPDHFEAPPAPMHYGRPSDPPPRPCAGWSRPPRISDNYSPSRHSVEPPVSHTAGGHGGWRPR
ncbi:protein HUA2-LIKE 2 isoform X3 [Zea mays]|uniref:protein HUA2-LIKE 2 isoform X3 n=2 Tax=Zea mays TaxID=4577 RepID=UPI0004DE85D3|nr:protein HUA2-LIKE 2 isoform X3 [Zea mays]|eukprot:XP_008660137.1 protein HUA2-LIKE 2 isoform X3 [Zea mays]